jgi:hypothetical protein
MMAGPLDPDVRPRSENWIILLSAAVSIVVGVVVHARFAQSNAEGLRACISAGINPLYCRNTEDYPAVLQWAYAVMCGWVAFFAVWVAHTLRAHPWRNVCSRLSGQRHPTWELPTRDGRSGTCKCSVVLEVIPVLGLGNQNGRAARPRLRLVRATMPTR